MTDTNPDKAPTPAPSTVASTSTAAVAAAPRRLDNTTACLPLVYGSMAVSLGKQADEYQTHQWTLYVRGPHGKEDLSPAIAKVIFQLHASFAQPTRELVEPPYEVTERGWGEFEAQIRIVWKDPLEKATVVSHGIKLYPPGGTAAAHADSTEAVVSESYDEVVFTDPTEAFFNQLQRMPSLPPVTYSQQQHFGTFSDTDHVLALLEAQKFLKSELANVKERLRIVDSELLQVDNDLRTHTEQQQQRIRTTPMAAARPVTKKTKTN